MSKSSRDLEHGRKETQKQGLNGSKLTGRSKTLALFSLYISMSVSMLSLTVVGTSMPVIIADLGGSQGAYTWVITATMLTSAITTPIWGKLADVTNKKVLLQTILIIFTLGSALSGVAQDAGQLIAFRIIQGAGTGGISTIGLIILAEIISPRERSKYMGITGSLMAVSQIGGPLLGGTITDLIGWRYNFYVAAPIALIALIFLQKNLHLHVAKRPIRLDIVGALLISSGVSSVLIWLTLGGTAFPWISLTSATILLTGVVLLVIAIPVEMRVPDPLIPITLFANRTFSMAVIASTTVGVAMFGTTIFIGQYFQLARGKTPVDAGLLTIPMMMGVFLASNAAGQLITRTGKWKTVMIAGASSMFLGILLLSLMGSETSFTYIGVSLFVLGSGIGSLMQNLTLLVQNSVLPDQTGVASSGVAFFRIIGGAISMSAMGTLLAHQMHGRLLQGFQSLNPEAIEKGTGLKEATVSDEIDALLAGRIPHLHELSEQVREIVKTSYADSIATVFLMVTPIVALSVLAMIFMPNKELGNLSNMQMREAKTAE